MSTIAALLLLAGCTADGDPQQTFPSSTATPYETLPIKADFQFTKDVYDGKAVQYYIPENPTGALWVFHGLNGGFATVQQIEWLEIYNLLVPFNVAIILNEALEPLEGDWDFTLDPEGNPDFVRLAAVRDYLINTTPLSEATPTLAIGFSHGGGFTTRFVNMAKMSGWDVRGFVIHNSSNYEGGGIPGMWIDAENDPDNGSPPNVLAASEECTEAAGVECPLLHGDELPMDPRRFARLPIYSLGTSQKIYDELVDLGYIDADGNRLTSDDEVVNNMDAVMAKYIAKSKMPSPTMPPTQIRVVWATHRVSSQHKFEEVDYLLDFLDL